MNDAAPPNPLSAVGPWELVAEGYAAEAALVMEPFAVRAVELALPPATAHVVDVAAGSGVLTLTVAPRVAKVDALDFSPQMLRHLEAGRRARGLDNVVAHRGDGMALPFADGSFDAAFSMFGLMFFPDRAKGLAELHRVLRPGGRAVVSSWAAVEESPLMGAMFGALRAADPSRPAPKKNLQSWENDELLASDVRAAGFVDVAVHPCEHALEITDADDIWTRMCRSAAPLVMMRKALGEERWASQAAIAKQWLKDSLGALPKKLSTKAFLAVGTKR